MKEETINEGDPEVIEDIIRCPGFPGFYGTMFGHSYIEDDEIIARAIVDATSEIFESRGICELSFRKLYSPIAYNYGNDEIDVELKWLKPIKDVYAEIDKEMFARYIKSVFTSRPGFTSFYSADSNDPEWGIEQLKQDTIQIEYLLTFLLRKVYKVTNYDILTAVIDKIGLNTEKDITVDGKVYNISLAMFGEDAFHDVSVYKDGVLLIDEEPECCDIEQLIREHSTKE